MIEETNALPTGFSLHRYQIESVLGQDDARTPDAPVREAAR